MRRDSVNVQVRFDPELAAALRAAAEERVVSVSRLIQLLVRDGLERLVPMDELIRAREVSDADGISAAS